MIKQNSIFKNLLNQSIPTMIAMFLQSIYDVVDMFFVGRISSQAISAVTLYTTIMWIFTFLNSVIGVSSVSMISQSVGRKNYKNTQDICEQTLSFKFLMGVLTSILLYISLKPLLQFYTNDQEVINLALEYGKVRILFLPILFSSFSVNTIFRCTEDSKTPMYIMIITALINMVLDPIFMFKELTIPVFNSQIITIKGLDLGVLGAGFATAISTSISFLIGFAILLHGTKKIKIRFFHLFKLIPTIDKNLLIIGTPGAMETLVKFLFEAVLLKFVSQYGVVAITAAGIGSKVYSLSMLPMHGFTMGGSVLIGKFLGEEKVKNAEYTSKLSGKINAFIMLIFTLVCFLFSEEIIGAFTKDQNVINLGKLMLPMSVISLVFLGYAVGISISFTGAGLNSPIFFSSIVAQWLVQVPLLYIIANIYKLPAQFLWLTYMPSDLIYFFMILHFYKKGRWKLSRV